MQMKSLKSKFITWIIGYWEKQPIQQEIDRLCGWGLKNLGVLKNIGNFTGKHLCGVSLDKVAGLQDLLKRDSNTHFFLWNLRNFKVHSEHPCGCFWQFEKYVLSTKFYTTTKQHGPQSSFETFFERKDALETRLATKIMSSSSLFSFLFFCYWHGKYVLEYLH